MKIFGRTAVSEFLEDFVVYRNLEPMDARLPPLEAVRSQVGLDPDTTPRKSTSEYARVMAHILKAAHRLGAPRGRIERVVYIGDTRLNDGTAFANICRAGDWPGLAFIGDENNEPERSDIEQIDVGAVLHANRWSALNRFPGDCARQGLPIDESTAVLLDLDKTTLGARGRNDRVINQARVEAALQTVKNIIGPGFDPDGFQATYDFFNHTRYHPFTTDNQDYLVYICLIVTSDLYSRDGLAEALDNQVIDCFDTFVEDVDRRSLELLPGLRQIHEDVRRRVHAGDPTPFKAFRSAEYLATAAPMGQAESGTPVAELLSKEIVITHEVRELMLNWRAQGALLFGLSDKPDEASIPSGELASQGYRPIHRIETSVVGEGDA